MTAWHQVAITLRKQWLHTVVQEGHEAVAGLHPTQLPIWQDPSDFMLFRRMRNVSLPHYACVFTCTLELFSKIYPMYFEQDVTILGRHRCSPNSTDIACRNHAANSVLNAITNGTLLCITCDIKQVAAHLKLPEPQKQCA